MSLGDDKKVHIDGTYVDYPLEYNLWQLAEPPRSLPQVPRFTD